MKTNLATLFGLLLVALALPVQAALVVYTDRSAFLAATTGVVTTDFEENATGGFTFYGSTYVGTGFSISDTSIFTVDPDFDPYYQWGTGDVLDMEGATATITVDSSVRAVGFDFGNPEAFFGSGFVTINGDDYALIGQPVFNFFGIVSDSAISPISVNWNGGLGIIDNVSISSVVVPEPGTVALLGLGLAGLAATRRRK